MVWLTDRDKNLKIYLFVLTESTNVTDGQTDRWTPHDGISSSSAKMKHLVLSEISCCILHFILHTVTSHKSRNTVFIIITLCHD